MDLTTVSPANAAAYLALAQIAPWLLFTGAYTADGGPHDPASAQDAVQKLLARVNADGMTRVAELGAPALRTLADMGYLGGKAYYQWQNATGKWKPNGFPYNTYVPPVFDYLPSGYLDAGDRTSAAQAAMCLLRLDPRTTAAVGKMLTDALGVNMGSMKAGDADHPGGNGALALRQAVKNARWLAREEEGHDPALDAAFGGDVSQDTRLPALVWPWVLAGASVVAGGAIYAIHKLVTLEERGHSTRERGGVNAFSSSPTYTVHYQEPWRGRSRMWSITLSPPHDISATIDGVPVSLEWNGHSFDIEPYTPAHMTPSDQALKAVSKLMREEMARVNERGGVNALKTTLLPARSPTDVYRTEVTEVTEDDEWREFLSRSEVPGRVRREHPEADLFVQWRNDYHPLSDFMRGGPKGWDGTLNFGWSSGLVVKSDGDRYKIGFYRLMGSPPTRSGVNVLRSHGESPDRPDLSSTRGYVFNVALGPLPEASARRLAHLLSQTALDAADSAEAGKLVAEYRASRRSEPKIAERFERILRSLSLPAHTSRESRAFNAMSAERLALRDAISREWYGGDDSDNDLRLEVLRELVDHGGYRRVEDLERLERLEHEPGTVDKILADMRPYVKRTPRSADEARRVGGVPGKSRDVVILTRAGQALAKQHGLKVYVKSIHEQLTGEHRQSDNNAHLMRLGY